MQDIAQNCPGLEKIHLYNTKVTDAGVKDLAWICRALDSFQFVQNDKRCLAISIAFTDSFGQKRPEKMLASLTQMTKVK